MKQEQVDILSTGRKSHIVSTHTGPSKYFVIISTSSRMLKGHYGTYTIRGTDYT